MSDEYGYQRVDTTTARLVQSDVEISVGDTVKRGEDKEMEIVSFDFVDGYISFRMSGEGYDDIVRNDVGSDLLSVWDISFSKGDYTLITE